MFKNLFRKAFLTICLWLFFLVFSQQAQAVEEFKTSYQSTYRIYETGTTRVTQKVKLTNNLSNVFAEKYSFIVGATQIKNISGHDDEGPLDINVIQLENQTKIEFGFNEVVAGKNKSLDFEFSFDSLDFAVKSGQVWELNLPRLNKAGQFHDYQVEVIVPKAFGSPSAIWPKPDKINRQTETNNFIFSGHKFKSSGINATFGQEQIFDFDLQYHLQNSRSFPVKTEIALPPDTNFQKIYLNKLEPEPKNVTVDADGNWLAEYHLDSGQQLNINAQGTAKIFLESQDIFQTNNLDDYLKKDEYWPVDDPKITNKARDLKTPEKIYQFVVDQLVYDYGRIKNHPERAGARQVLEEPTSALCMEFTDLFITLARSAGIPARAVTGYAYTHNSKLKPLMAETDLLHTWPEYYDQSTNSWHQVDPTWENTTGGVDFFNNFDLNHFAFTIHGRSSIYPLPAGAYKINGQEQKDVDISFGQSVQPRTSLASRLALSVQGLPWQPINTQLIAGNTGNQALYNININSDHQLLKINNPQITSLPPFAQQKIPAVVKLKPSLKAKTVDLNWQINKQSFSQTLDLPGIFDPIFLPYALVLITPSVLILLVFTLTAKIVKKR